MGTDRDTLDERARAAFLRGAEAQSWRDRGRALTPDEQRRVMAEYQADPDVPAYSPGRLDETVRPGRVDVRPLRMEAQLMSPADHFCPLCGCTKSGWEDAPNPGCEWCEDPYCPCHDEEFGLSNP